jgi:hypothetical protein
MHALGEETQSSSPWRALGLWESVASVEHNSDVFALCMLLWIAIVGHVSRNCSMNGVITTLYSYQYHM